MFQKVHYFIDLSGFSCPFIRLNVSISEMSSISPSSPAYVFLGYVWSLLCLDTESHSVKHALHWIFDDLVQWFDHHLNFIRLRKVENRSIDLDGLIPIAIAFLYLFFVVRKSRWSSLENVNRLNVLHTYRPCLWTKVVLWQRFIDNVFWGKIRNL